MPEPPVGKSYPPTTYAVGREKIREYTHAIGETNPLHLDPQAAQAAGYADVVAPPMFAVVYGAPAVMPALFDPELAINVAMLVHGAQDYTWGPLVLAGDEITTTVTLADVARRVGMTFFVFETRSVNQRDETVSVGLWSNIVREG